MSDDALMGYFRSQYQGLGDDEITRRIEGAAYGARPVEPEQPIVQDTGGFIDDLWDSVQRSAYYRPLMNLRAAIGDFEGAKRIEQQLASDPSLQTSSGAAEFIGEVVGQAAPSVLAMAVPVTAPGVLAYYGAQSFGAGRKAYRDYKTEAGEEVNAGEEFTVGLGYGLAEFAAEKLGLKYLQKIGLEGAKSLGKGLLKNAAVADPNAAMRLLIAGTKAAGVGGSDEAAAQVGQNLVDLLYKKENTGDVPTAILSLFEGVGEAAAYGAAGGVLAGGAGALANRNNVTEADEDADLRARYDIPVSRKDEPILHFAREYLTSRRDLPQQIANLDQRRRGEYNEQLKIVEGNIGNLKGVVTEEYGPIHKLDEATLNTLGRALKGEVVDSSLPVEEQVKVLDTLPEKVREPIQDFRNHIDALSRKMKDDGLIDGDLAVTVDKNMGMYVARAYRVYDDPKWVDKVPDTVRARFRTWAHEEYRDQIAAELYKEQRGKAYRAPREGVEPGETQARSERFMRALKERMADPNSNEFAFAHGRIVAMEEELLNKDNTSPLATLSKSKLGAKNLSLFKRKGEVPQEIRALWGEYTDPFNAYSKTVARMAQYVANQRFLMDSREWGLDKVFFKSARMMGNIKFSQQIAAPSTSTMSPLNGLYTTPEIAQAFQSMFDGPKDISPLYAGYLKVLGFSKEAKTKYSLMTQVRNFTANPLISMAQGHFNVFDPFTYKNIRNFSTAFKASFPDVYTTKDFKVMAGGVETTRSEYLQKLARLGVIDESADINEINEINREIKPFIDNVDVLAENPSRFGRVINFISKKAGKLYQASDNYWKVMGFESELARYREAFPNMPETQLEERVAGIIRDTMPTYSKVNKLARMVRRTPLVGPFVSFPAEIIRTAYHTAKLIKTELANPATRSIGAHRLAGTLSATAFTTGVSAFTRALIGVGKEEEDDIRRFMPDYQKNAQFAFLGKQGGGIRRFVDLSYTDPYQYLKTPFVAFFNGEDDDKALIGFVKEFFAPFLSEEIVTSKLLDVARNEKRQGGQVFNPEAPFEQKAYDVITHVAEAVEPGVLRGVRRVGQGLAGRTESYGAVKDPGVEAAAQVTGVRTETLDVVQALSYKVSNFNESSRGASKIFTSVANRRGHVTEGELTRAYEATETSRKEMFEDMSQDIRAAVRLGVTERQVYEILRNQRVPKKVARALIRGGYVPYSPDEEGMRRMISRARVMYQNEDAQRSVDELTRRRQAINEMLMNRREVAL